MKIIFFSLLITCLTLVATAQIDTYNEEIYPPIEVEYALEDQHPNAELRRWFLRGQDRYMAEVDIDGNRAEVVLTKDGRWVETITELQRESLPDEIQDYLDDNFDEDEFFQGSTQKKENNREQTTYLIIMESDEAAHILWFDANGKLTKEDVASYDGWDEFDEEDGF